MVDVKLNWAKLLRALELGIIFGAVNFIFAGDGRLAITMALALIYLEFFFRKD